MDVEASKVKIHGRNVGFHRGKKNLEYFDVSAKSGYNHGKPFLYLARELTGDPSLVFVEVPGGAGFRGADRRRSGHAGDGEA